MHADAVRITVLMDNVATDGLESEHGLSLWIEAAGIHILLDTGQSGGFLRNAAALGISVRDADVVVLSHGHYDHTGGLPALVTAGLESPVFLHPGALQKRFSVREGVAKPNGMTGRAREALRAFPARGLRWVSQPLWLSRHVGVSGGIPRKTDYEDTGGPFFLDQAGRHADPIEDDMAIWIETGKGLIVCTGCCHAGLINTLDWVRAQCPGRPILAVIGGLHLMAAHEERMRQTIAELRSADIGQIVPLHCTGASAVDRLQAELGDRVITMGRVGAVFGF